MIIIDNECQILRQAGDAVAALKSSLKPLATVKRDGVWSNIDAVTIVPGDDLISTIFADKFTLSRKLSSRYNSYYTPHFFRLHLALLGDLVLLASGSAVPADCVINHGNIEVDQAALTGESLPVSMHQGRQLC